MMMMMQTNVWGVFRQLAFAFDTGTELYGFFVSKEKLQESERVSVLGCR
jgi:hypothetical protein